MSNKPEIKTRKIAGLTEDYTLCPVCNGQQKILSFNEEVKKWLLTECWKCNGKGEI